MKKYLDDLFEYVATCDIDKEGILEKIESIYRETGAEPPEREYSVVIGWEMTGEMPINVFASNILDACNKAQQNFTLTLDGIQSSKIISKTHYPSIAKRLN